MLPRAEFTAAIELLTSVSTVDAPARVAMVSVEAMEISEPPSDMFCTDRVMNEVALALARKLMSEASEPSSRLAPSNWALFTTSVIWCSSDTKLSLMAAREVGSSEGSCAATTFCLI